MDRERITFVLPQSIITTLYSRGHSHYHVYLTGSFSNWKDLPEYLYNLTPDQHNRQVTANLKPGYYEYKYHAYKVQDGKRSGSDVWLHDSTQPATNDPHGGRNNILKVHESGPNGEKSIRIYHISDTHNQFLPIPDPTSIDILIHSGDFSTWGHPHKIVILGNHDIVHMMQHHMDALREAKRMLSNAVVLNSEVIELYGVKIFGVEWHWFNRWNFYGYERTIEKLMSKDNLVFENIHGLKEHWDQMPPGMDIFVTHHPPFGILDQGCGSAGTLEVIKKRMPRYHLFGHLHSAL